MTSDDVVSLKEYINTLVCHLRKELITRIDSNKELAEQRFRAIEVSTKEAKGDMSQRLESMNEFRTQLKEQASHFITRIEYDKMIEDIRELRESRAELSGKASVASVLGVSDAASQAASSANNAKLIAILTGILAALLSILLKYIG
jgi:predicted phage gp36 major capsid-like protein